MSRRVRTDARWGLLPAGTLRLAIMIPCACGTLRHNRPGWRD